MFTTYNRVTIKIDNMDERKRAFHILLKSREGFTNKREGIFNVTEEQLDDLRNAKVDFEYVS